MKLLLFLAAIVTLAQAGVQELLPYEEDEALTLYSKICSGSSEGGAHGDIYVFCKPSNAVVTEAKYHTVVIPPTPSKQRQVIFVQPPTYKYNHQIEIKGDAGPAQQASIYVLPQKNEHTFEHTYSQPPSAPVKPVVYYLKTQYGQAADSVYGSSNPALNTRYGAPANDHCFG